MDGTDIRTLTALELGCGRAKTPWDLRATGPDGAERPVRWTLWRLDADPAVKPDLVCRLGQDPIPLPDDSVHLVIAHHVLEHIGRQGETGEWFAFWEDLYRVMAPGARIQFDVPLASSVWAWADPTHCRALNEYAFLYLRQQSYRLGGSIPAYRIACDFVPIEMTRLPDGTNADVRALETHSYLHGVLEAQKPLRPWWEDPS